MLVINEELFAIEDAVDALVNDFKTLNVYRSYQEASKNVRDDAELQKKLQRFHELNEQWESEKDFISFRPDIRDLKKAMLGMKRQLDLDPKIIALRFAEVDCQKVLSEMTSAIALSVSETIFVDTGLPMAKKQHQHGSATYENIKEKD